MVQQSCDFARTSQLNQEEWTALLRSTCGSDHRVVEPDALVAWMHRLSVYGIAAAATKIQSGLATIDHGADLYRFEQTHGDARLDVDWYCALFPVAGRSWLTQNDHTIQFGVGDIGLGDGARPFTRLSETGSQWLSIYLPRQSLISHLGFEPQTCLCGRGETLAARVLRQYVLEGIKDEESAAAGSAPHMQFALYDLLSAVFAPSEPWPGSRYSDKLFARIRRIIRDGFADPTFGPNEIAAETGISLRYLQKLFTERGLTCTEFISSLRLDHAAHLVHRRALLGKNQPLSEIAYACGFRDYTHFARKFRHRFGHVPGAHPGEPDRCGDRGVRTGTGESAS